MSRRLILRNFLSLSAGQVVTFVVGLVSGIYMRRVLGVNAIGQLAWSSAVITYFSLWVNPGLESIAQRDMARTPNRANEYVARIISLQLLLALVGMLVLVGFAACQVRGPVISQLLVLQGLGLLLMPWNLSWLLRAREQMGAQVLVTALLQVLQLPVLFWLVRDPSHLMRYVLYPYPFTIVAIGLTLWLVGRSQDFTWRQIRLSLRGNWGLLREAMPLGFSQMAGLIYLNSDSILLGFLRGDTVVGLYGTAYRLWCYATIPFNALYQAYFPALARASSDEPAQQKISSEFYLLHLWLGLPAAAVCWALGRHIVFLLYGEPFAESGPLFEWLSLNIALSSFTWSVVLPLNAWGHQKKTFYITVFPALINLGLNLVIIPHWGATGAVVTTLLAETLALVAGLIVRRRICPLPWWRLCLKPLVTAVVLAALVRFFAQLLPSYWAWSFVLGSGWYLLALYLMEKPLLAKIASRLKPGGNS